MAKTWTYRTTLFDASAPKRAVELSMNADLVARGREEGLDLSALAERAIAAELARHDRALFDATMAESGREHDEYLAKYGSLSDALEHIDEQGGEARVA